MRHEIRDLEAELLSVDCKDMVIEPMIIPPTEMHYLPRTVSSEENARLDISCRNFWRSLQKSFLTL